MWVFKELSLTTCIYVESSNIKNILLFLCYTEYKPLAVDDLNYC